MHDLTAVSKKKQNALTQSQCRLAHCGSTCT